MSRNVEITMASMSAPLGCVVSVVKRVNPKQAKKRCELKQAKIKANRLKMAGRGFEPMTSRL